MTEKTVRLVKKSPRPVEIAYTRFAALDFETADYGRDSACAISVIVAENGAIKKKFYSLIRPPRRDFIFSYLHGITWKDVATQPRFHELWPDIKKLLTNIDFIAAHNAAFDRSVLFSCCSNAGIDNPEHDFLCTVKLARKQWNLFPTKLPDVCNYLEIPLKHHDAYSDTLACAKIVLAMKGAPVPISAFLKKKRVRPDSVSSI